MLVFSRQRDEKVVIIAPDGTELEIKVVDIRGDKVRLGMDGPRDYQIHRKEVWDSIKKEGRHNGHV